MFSGSSGSAIGLQMAYVARQLVSAVRAFMRRISKQPAVLQVAAMLQDGTDLERTASMAKQMEKIATEMQSIVPASTTPKNSRMHAEKLDALCN